MAILNEWSNQNLPLSNGTGMRNMARLRVPPSPTFVNLGNLFGGLTPTGQHGGHFLSVKADMTPGATGGAKFYFVLAANAPTMLAQPNIVGNLPGVCLPLSDGETYRGRIVSHQEGGVTGWATMVHYNHLHYTSWSHASGPAPSGYLTLHWSSIPEGQSRNPFPRP